MSFTSSPLPTLLHSACLYVRMSFLLVTILSLHCCIVGGSLISSWCQASVCLSVLSHHNKDLEWWTLRPSVHHGSWVLDRVIALRSWTDRIIVLRQISVTALFYLENSRKIHPPGVRACQLRDVKRREWGSAPALGGERENTLAPLLICLFLPPGPAYVNWAAEVSDLPLFYFRVFFLPYLLATAVLDSCFLF